MQVSVAVDGLMYRHVQLHSLGVAFVPLAVA